MSQITSIKWGDGTYSGTAEGFILHWCALVHEFNDLVEPGRRIQDEIKLTMLQTAVRPLETLASVQNTSEMVKGSGTAIDFDFYYSLLTSAAENYDIKTQATGGKVKRRVYMQEIDSYVTQYKDGNYEIETGNELLDACLLYTSPSPRD